MEISKKDDMFTRHNLFSDLETCDTACFVVVGFSDGTPIEGAVNCVEDFREFIYNSLISTNLEYLAGAPKKHQRNKHKRYISVNHNLLISVQDNRGRGLPIFDNTNHGSSFISGINQDKLLENIEVVWECVCKTAHYIARVDTALGGIAKFTNGSKK